MKTGITVTGSGQASAPPDRASISLGVGEILRVGLDTIGNGAEMHGVDFSLRDPSVVAGQARDLAYQAAMAKAAQLAALTGRGLGPASSIVESEGHSIAPKMMARMDLGVMPVVAAPPS